jgi:hypothetical protein
MENDITIRVRDHPLTVGDPHAPQHDVVSRPEGMDVETLADPDHALALQNREQKEIP